VRRRPWQHYEWPRRHPGRAIRSGTRRRAEAAYFAHSATFRDRFPQRLSDPGERLTNDFLVPASTY
jgi:hypothetical protein